VPSKSRWTVYGLSAGLGDSLGTWNVVRGGHSRFLVREPLARQSWPVQSVGDDQIIQVGSILLPRVGAGVIHLGGSALSDVRTMSCIPGIASAPHRLCLRVVDVYLVD